jgi:HAD superfamily hydrolase (TIGR01484 family)
MIKMVVTDVDGTLVKESTLNINPEYFEVIRKLTEKGIKVVMASGRQYESIRKLIEPVQDLVWYIADGGATMKMDNGLEAVAAIPREWVKTAWQDISNIPGMECALGTPEKSYVPYEGTELYNLIKYDYKFNVEVLGGWEKLPEEEISKLSLFIYAKVSTFLVMESTTIAGIKPFSSNFKASTLTIFKPSPKYFLFVTFLLNL